MVLGFWVLTICLALANSFTKLSLDLHNNPVKWILLFLVCLGVNEGLDTFMTFQIIKLLFLHLIVCYFSQHWKVYPCLMFCFKKYRCECHSYFLGIWFFFSFSTLSTYLLLTYFFRFTYLACLCPNFFLCKNQTTNKKPYKYCS